MAREDHDLLIEISVGQKELKSDVRAMSDALREMKASLDATNERQRDQDNRLTNLTTTVTRLQTDQYNDHKDIAAVKADTIRWKLYMKIGAILGSPIYVVLLALLIDAAKKLLGL
jgi:hypothetical protein